MLTRPIRHPVQASTRVKALWDRPKPYYKLHCERYTPQETDQVDWSLVGSSVMGSVCLESMFNEGLADGGASTALLPGVSLTQGTILIAPVLLYSIFSVYRTGFNRNAKISDFLFLVGAIVIFGNIFSAFIFKVRLF